MHTPHLTQPRKHSLAARLGVAILALAVSPVRGESWQVILPAADFAPKGQGIFLMADPYSTGPAPGLLFAGYPYDASLASVTRITPLDAAHSGFAVEPLNPLDVRAREVVHNPGDGWYVVGESPWNVRRSSEENQGHPGTWEIEDTFRFSWVTGTGKKQTVNQGGSRSMGAVVDTTGTVWVAGGTASSPSPRTTWTVVRNQPGHQPGQPWQDSADGSDSWSQRVYPLGADSWSRGRGMVDDGQGSVYLTGDVFHPTATSLEVLVGLLRWAPSNP